jgi:hypothetical protein
MTNPRELWEPAPQPPPPGGGYPPVGPPHSGPVNGQRWVPPPLPPPRRPRRSPIVAIVAIAVVVALIITIVLTRDSDSASHVGVRRADPAASTTPTQPQPGGPDGGSAPVRPPASLGAPPTGVEYGSEQQPAPGECVDTGRTDKGVVLYRADCNVPTTPLVLDRTMAASQKCEPHGYYSIRGFDQRVMCFTWQVQEGDCLDLNGPRQAPCKAGGPPDYGTVTVTGLHVGGTDGTGCPDPNRWLQAGHGSTRGVACFMPTGMTESGAPAPSTR